jgi:hypothetical protein
MILFLLSEANTMQQPSHIWAIFLGVFIGIGIASLLGWGILALFGKRFAFRIGLIIACAFMGLLGAIGGDMIAVKKRPMTEAEIDIAKRIFGETINYKRVKLAFGSKLMGFKASRAPFETIYFSKRVSSEHLSTACRYCRRSFIHELTHVWQTQHNITFWEKLKTALGGKKMYKYEGFKGLQRDMISGKQFLRYNTEQQGDILAEAIIFPKSAFGSPIYQFFVNQVKSMPYDSVKYH